jgi:transcription antitermination factor NusG
VQRDPERAVACTYIEYMGPARLVCEQEGEAVYSPSSDENFDSINWYAIQTRAKHEKSVSAFLEGKGYDQFLPLYQSWHRSSGRLKSVFLPLFSGYLFGRFDKNRRLPILMTPGVAGIVGRGKEPEPILAEEIARIQVSCASGLKMTPWPYLEGGEPVRVECGPLRGVEGIFVTEKSNCRLVISVGILRRSVAVEVDRDWIRPLTIRRGISNCNGSRAFQQGAAKIAV